MNNYKSNSESNPNLSEFCYKWYGKDKSGLTTEGQIFASSKTMAKALLLQKGNEPHKVWKKSKPIFSNQKKLKPADVAIFSRQLATMLKAGVPLVQSFEIVGSTAENDKMREIIKEIHFEVASGSSLALSLAKHPKYFDKLYCGLVSSGESSGTLETMLDRIATYKEKSEKLKAKIRKALTYPTAVVFVAVIVTAILLIKVVPQFAATFKNFGAELPFYTRLILELSNFTQDWWLVFTIGISILAYLFTITKKKSRTFSNFVDGAIIKIPIIGPILRNAIIARFSRTLSTTCSAGVPLVDALDSTAGAVGNYVYSKAIGNAKENIAAGSALSQSLSHTKLFPNVLMQMVAVGEESGTLDDMLGKVADYYEDAVDDAVENLSSLLEPLIMAILGILIGGLMIAMYLPIFLLGSVI
tara:strand:- start:1047 stop:2288 length:1242 start_codon:yes stop_codon:yes gene_type:complete